MIKRYAPVFFFVMIYSYFVSADAPVALISSAQGTAQVLTEATASEQQETLLFEGKKYRFSNAKIGRKVAPGEVLMTGTDGKLKIIFEHGDVAVLGPSTSLVVPKIGSKLASDKTMELMYGRVRAVIDKDGPLSGLKIKTPTAVAGVRGTDLSVSYNPSGQGTQVEVIRGEVEVKLPDQTKTVEVKTGEVAKVTLVEDAPKVTQAPVVKAEVLRATEQDLNVVQAASTITPEKERVAAVTVEQKQEIATAEKSAVAIAIKDIQRYDPKSAQRVAQNDIKTTDDINKYAVDEIRTKSPEVKPEAPVALTPEQVRRKGWDWVYGFIITSADVSTGFCSGGFSQCSNSVPYPGAEFGLLKNFSIFGSRFTFRTGALVSIRTDQMNSLGGSLSYYEAGVDVPLQFGYDFGTYSVHLGPVAMFQAVAAPITCASGNLCNAKAVSNGTAEVAVGKIFSEKWKGEIAFQMETNIFNASFNCGNCGGNSTTGINASSIVIRADKYWF